MTVIVNMCTVCLCVSAHAWVCLCMSVHVTRSIWPQSCHLEHQVSVWHMRPPFAAAVLLSGDTPAHLNGLPNFLSVTSITLSGLTYPGCDDRMTNHEINSSRCSTSKEINFL